MTPDKDTCTSSAVRAGKKKRRQVWRVQDSREDPAANPAAAEPSSITAVSLNAHFEHSRKHAHVSDPSATAKATITASPNVSTAAVETTKTGAGHLSMTLGMQQYSPNVAATDVRKTSAQQLSSLLFFASTRSNKQEKFRRSSCATPRQKRAEDAAAVPAQQRSLSSSTLPSELCHNMFSHQSAHMLPSLPGCQEISFSQRRSGLTAETAAEGAAPSAVGVLANAAAAVGLPPLPQLLSVPSLVRAREAELRALLEGLQRMPNILQQKQRQHREERLQLKEKLHLEQLPLRERRLLAQRQQQQREASVASTAAEAAGDKQPFQQHQHLAKRAFQLLPVELRRRCMSHNPYRIPRRCRPSVLADMEKTPPRPSRRVRKDRRRPRELLKIYALRARSHARSPDIAVRPDNAAAAAAVADTSAAFRAAEAAHAGVLPVQQPRRNWLPTHFYHARRFHMLNVWGYRLASHPTQKCQRKLYRHCRNKVLLHDRSYMQLLQLSGPIASVAAVLAFCGADVALLLSDTYTAGRQRGRLLLFTTPQPPMLTQQHQRSILAQLQQHQHDSFTQELQHTAVVHQKHQQAQDGACLAWPTQQELIAPVHFLWKPPQLQHAQSRQHEGEQQRKDTEARRVLWLWVHPSAAAAAELHLRIAAIAVTVGSEQEHQQQQQHKEERQKQHDLRQREWVETAVSTAVTIQRIDNVMWYELFGPQALSLLALTLKSAPRRHQLQRQQPQNPLQQRGHLPQQQRLPSHRKSNEAAVAESFDTQSVWEKLRRELLWNGCYSSDRSSSDSFAPPPGDAVLPLEVLLPPLLGPFPPRTRRLLSVPSVPFCQQRGHQSRKQQEKSSSNNATSCFWLNSTRECSRLFLEHIRSEIESSEATAAKGKDSFWRPVCRSRKRQDVRLLLLKMRKKQQEKQLLLQQRRMLQQQQGEWQPRKPMCSGLKRVHDSEWEDCVEEGEKRGRQVHAPAASDNSSSIFVREKRRKKVSTQQTERAAVSQSQCATPIASAGGAFINTLHEEEEDLGTPVGEDEYMDQRKQEPHCSDVHDGCGASSFCAGPQQQQPQKRHAIAITTGNEAAAAAAAMTSSVSDENVMHCRSKHAVPSPSGYLVESESVNPTAARMVRKSAALKAPCILVWRSAAAAAAGKILPVGGCTSKISFSGCSRLALRKAAAEAVVTATTATFDSSMCSGVDIFLPRTAATARLFVLLCRYGARAIGLRDRRKLQLEAGIPDFPFDYPDSAAGAVAALCCCWYLELQHRRKPPSKRMNFAVTASLTPFLPCWALLLTGLQQQQKQLLQQEHLKLREQPPRHETSQQKQRQAEHQQQHRAVEHQQMQPRQTPVHQQGQTLQQQQIEQQHQKPDRQPLCGRQMQEKQCCDDGHLFEWEQGTKQVERHIEAAFSTAVTSDRSAESNSRCSKLGGTCTFQTGQPPINGGQLVLPTRDLCAAAAAAALAVTPIAGGQHKGKRSAEEAISCFLPAWLLPLLRNASGSNQKKPFCLPSCRSNEPLLPPLPAAVSPLLRLPPALGAVPVVRVQHLQLLRIVLSLRTLAHKQQQTKYIQQDINKQKELQQQQHQREVVNSSCCQKIRRVRARVSTPAAAAVLWRSNGGAAAPGVDSSASSFITKVFNMLHCLEISLSQTDSPHRGELGATAAAATAVTDIPVNLTKSHQYQDTLEQQDQIQQQERIGGKQMQVCASNLIRRRRRGKRGGRQRQTANTTPVKTAHSEEGEPEAPAAAAEAEVAEDAAADAPKGDVAQTATRPIQCQEDSKEVATSPPTAAEADDAIPSAVRPAAITSTAAVVAPAATSATTLTAAATAFVAGDKTASAVDIAPAAMANIIVSTTAVATSIAADDSAPAAGVTAPAAGLTGPAAGLTGPAAVLTGPAAGLTAPAAGLTGPAAGLTGPTAGLTGPAASLIGPAAGVTATAAGVTATAAGVTATAAGVTAPAVDVTAPAAGVTTLAAGMTAPGATADATESVALVEAAITVDRPPSAIETVAVADTTATATAAAAATVSVQANRSFLEGKLFSIELQQQQRLDELQEELQGDGVSQQQQQQDEEQILSMEEAQLLVPVRLEAFGRGVPRRLCQIFLPTEEDLQYIFFSYCATFSDAHSFKNSSLSKFLLSWLRLQTNFNGSSSYSNKSSHLSDSSSSRSRRGAGEARIQLVQIDTNFADFYLEEPLHKEMRREKLRKTFRGIQRTNSCVKRTSLSAFDRGVSLFYPDAHEVAATPAAGSFVPQRALRKGSNNSHNDQFLLKQQENLDKGEVITRGKKGRWQQQRKQEQAGTVWGSVGDQALGAAVCKNNKETIFLQKRMSNISTHFGQIHATRQLIGFITGGHHSLLRGKGFGVGCISAAAFLDALRLHLEVFCCVSPAAASAGRSAASSSPACSSGGCRKKTPPFSFTPGENADLLIGVRLLVWMRNPQSRVYKLGWLSFISEE